MRVVRIFVSSPRDVGSERALAAGTLDRLRFEFRGVCDTPDILVYRKTEELRAAIQSREQVMERLAQRDAVQDFIERYFRAKAAASRPLSANSVHQPISRRCSKPICAS